MTIILFIFTISILLVHEMDAIRTKEWKMFIILKDMAEETAYRVFTLLHIPLYFIAFYIMAQGNTTTKTILYYIVDIFLISHTIIHFFFRKNPNNGFNSVFSKIIIYFMGILAIIHLSLLLFNT